MAYENGDRNINKIVNKNNNIKIDNNHNLDNNSNNNKNNNNNIKLPWLTKYCLHSRDDAKLHSAQIISWQEASRSEGWILSIMLTMSADTILSWQLIMKGVWERVGGGMDGVSARE